MKRNLFGQKKKMKILLFFFLKIECILCKNPMQLWNYDTTNNSGQFDCQCLVHTKTPYNFCVINFLIIIYNFGIVLFAAQMYCN